MEEKNTKSYEENYKRVKQKLMRINIKYCIINNVFLTAQNMSVMTVRYRETLHRTLIAVFTSGFVWCLVHISSPKMLFDCGNKNEPNWSKIKCTLICISLFHMKIMMSVKSSYQDCGTCYLHLPISFLNVHSPLLLKKKLLKCLTKYVVIMFKF